NQAQHLHGSAISLDDFRADHLVDAVIAAFDQHVGFDMAQQVFRSAFGEADHPVHSAQSSKYSHATVNAVDRTTRPFQAADGSVVVDVDDQAITLSAGLFQISHVTGVQDVEAAVGEDDFFFMRTRIVDCQQQLIQAQHAAFGTLFALNR